MPQVRFKALLLCFPVMVHAAEPKREVARRLLDSATEMTSAVHPETGVAALMRAGMAYGTLDKKTALALLSRAFSALPAVTNAEVREEYAVGIVRAAAALDVQTATELLRQLPRPAPATAAVVRQLAADKQFDQAMELLALMPEQQEYPYEAASYLIAYLPADDSRRTIAFGRAASAFARLPAGPFPAMVERFGKHMPAELRNNAVSAMLRRIEGWKDSSESFAGTANDNESDIELHSPQQSELRELVSVARLFDPAAVERIVAQRADMAGALATFRKPRNPVEPIATEPAKDKEDDDPMSPPFGLGMADNLDGFRQRIEEYGKATKQAEKVHEALKKDPTEAVRLARGLPDTIRAEVLAVIASSVMSKDPAFAVSVVDSCVAEVERIGNPAYRIPALVKLGGIHAKLKDSARAFAGYERALADAMPLWAKDTKADRPNIASRDTWPSTQAVRMTAHEAALSLGVDAEGLLSGMTVSDLALLARVQMAQALLGMPHGIHQINVRWVEEK